MCTYACPYKLLRIPPIALTVIEIAMQIYNLSHCALILLKTLALYKPFTYLLKQTGRIHLVTFVLAGGTKTVQVTSE